MPAYVSCRPDVYDGHAETGCFVVCAAHDLRISFGFSHAVAQAACKEHNALHHPAPRAEQQRLLSIIYRSVQARDLTATDLSSLLLEARHRNRAFGITGMLLAQDGQFLQALEGPEVVVRSLLASIVRDRRHEQVAVLAEEVVQARRFPDWAMADGHIGELAAQPLRGYYEALLIARGAALA